MSAVLSYEEAEFLAQNFEMLVRSGASDFIYDRLRDVYVRKMFLPRTQIVMSAVFHYLENSVPLPDATFLVSLALFDKSDAVVDDSMGLPFRLLFFGCGIVGFDYDTLWDRGLGEMLDMYLNGVCLEHICG